jgi:Fungalysin/Thermolysin Propeptide Motif
MARRIGIGAVTLALIAVLADPSAAAIFVPRPLDGISPRAPGLAIDPADAAQTSALRSLRAASSAPVKLQIDHGQPRALQGAIPVAPGTLDEQGGDFADRFAAGLWRLGPNSELVLARTDPGTGLASFRQRYRGLPVIGGELNVLIADGSVRAAIGTLMPGDGLDITPRVSGEEARRIVASREGGQLAPP